MHDGGTRSLATPLHSVLDDYARYPLKPRLDPLKSIFAKLGLPMPLPLPPLWAGIGPRVRHGAARAITGC
jgi:hypothetical protein